MGIYLSEKQLIELGRITAAFSSLEAVVSAGIQMAIGPDQSIGRIVASQLSFKRSAELLSALLRKRIGEGDEFQELQETIKEALMAEDRRNQIIHSDWWPGDDENTSRRIKSVVRIKKGLVSQTETLSAQDLGSIAEIIWSARARLARLLEKFAIDGTLPGVTKC